MRKLKLAVVDWADSATLGGKVWWKESELPETVIDVTIRNVGYELRRNAMEIVLVSGKSDHTFCEPFGIPMGCVKKIRYIKEPK